MIIRNRKSTVLVYCDHNNARAPVEPTSAVGRRALDISMSIGYKRCTESNFDGS